MTDATYDAIILGQGLAGTTLGWALHRQGLRICLIDPDREATASRIAAGLVTPITGKRFSLTWQYDRFLAEAVDFYRGIEALTAATFFSPREHERLFVTSRELQDFEARLARDPGVAKHSVPGISAESRGRLTCPLGGFTMPTAGQLNVRNYLNASRVFFQERNSYRAAEISCEEIELGQSGVGIPRLGLFASRLIFCRGAEDRGNPWFPRIRFLPAQGEILTLSVDYPLDRVLHRQVWLAPGEDGTVYAGSTYAWDRLDGMPTLSGREEICRKLAEFFPYPCEVIAHQAAIRPALHDQRPVLGMHPRWSRLGIMNGLGSKGSLQAPWLARHFAEHLAQGTPLDPELDVQRKYPP